MNKCIEAGLNLDVELEELNELKTRHEQVEWLEEISDYLDDEVEFNSPSSFDELRQVLDAGRKLPSHPAIERALGQISGLITQVEEWEEKAKQYLNAKPRFALYEVEKLVAEGEQISQRLPSLGNLKEAVKKAKEWMARAETIKNPDNFPYIDSMETLVARGRPLPVKLEALTHLETQVAQARAWRERTARVFLKKSNSSSGTSGGSSLLDVLAPRTDIGTGSGTGGESGSGAKRNKKNKRQPSGDDSKDSKDSGSVNINHPIYQTLTAKDLAIPQSVVKAFKDAEIKELQALKEYRSKNDSSADKDSKENSGGGGGSGTKFECELCRDSFHPSHLPVPPTLQQQTPGGDGNKPLVGGKPTSLRDIKFLCPNCLRSRRPRLETILSLLVSLSKLTVRLPEGEALQCLTERAMSWRERAQQALDSKDVVESLAKLKEHQAKAEAKKQSKKKPSDSSTEGSESDAGGNGGGSSDEELEGVKPDTKQDKHTSVNNLPEIKLSQKSVNNLERLMMEGDLLEVSMDETQHMWRLLQAVEPRRSRRYPDLNKLEAELESAREEKLRAKKKRKLAAADKAADSMSSDGYDTDSTVASDVGKTPSKKAKKAVTPSGENKKQTSQKKTASKKGKGDDDQGQEEQEDCSAAKCLRPVGKEVHWVQCDACELWLHLNCIGLKPEQVSEDEEFICKSCKPKSKPQKKVKAK